MRRPLTSLLLAPRGAGALPFSRAFDPGEPVTSAELRVSLRLTREVRAWAGRPRVSPADELEFLVQAHRLAADLQVELGLETTIYCVDTGRSPAPRDEPYAHRVKIMHEWSADFPVWGADYGLGSIGAWIGLLDEGELSVSSSLVQRFEAWNREWESWFPSTVDDSSTGDDSTTDPVIPAETQLAHEVVGHLLAADLQSELGLGIFVVYPAANG